jgi:hypothetical protein
MGSVFARIVSIQVNEAPLDQSVLDLKHIAPSASAPIRSVGGCLVKMTADVVRFAQTVRQLAERMVEED